MSRPLLFVRGPGSTTADLEPVTCPGPGQSVPISVSVRVPSWGRKESALSFTFDLSDRSGTGTVTPSVTAGWS